MPEPPPTGRTQHVNQQHDTTFKTPSSVTPTTTNTHPLAVNNNSQPLAALQSVHTVQGDAAQRRPNGAPMSRVAKIIEGYYFQLGLREEVSKVSERESRATTSSNAGQLYAVFRLLPRLLDSRLTLRRSANTTSKWYEEVIYKRERFKPTVKIPQPSSLPLPTSTRSKATKSQCINTTAKELHNTTTIRQATRTSTTCEWF
ncbi:hypothetical protein BC829DRAFT_412801 [Chytridium lagenaria]|nr:hypothetical protein BC829DRAFT_412801 [Chytridium lagenaria]